VSKSGYRRLTVQSIFAAVGFLILVSLGVWQVQRLQWKEALIARVDSRLDAPPVPAPGPQAWPTLDLAAAEYEPLTVTGHYLNDKEAHVVFALTEPKGPVGGIGYMVMTPFETGDGWIVYVNRGFVPQDRKDPASRGEGIIVGTTTVSGLLREASRAAWFSPADDPAHNEWFSRDPGAFAAASGLPAEKVAPYIIDAVADPTLAGGLPQGGETLVSFPNNHLQYALTWFGLAIALAVIFTTFALRQRKR